MVHFKLHQVLVFSLLLLLAGAAPPPPAQKGAVAAFAKVKGGVFVMTATHKGDFGTRTVKASCFCVAKDHVVTCLHVVEGAGKVTATVDSKEITATVVGRFPESDLAVLRIEAPGTVVLTLREKVPEVGEKVLAVGNPRGLGISITAGVVSAIDRTAELGKVKLRGLVQHDAAVNQGNSGGPLVDVDGMVIGVNAAYHADAQGVGFAVPASAIRAAMKKVGK